MCVSVLREKDSALCGGGTDSLYVINLPSIIPPPHPNL